MNSSPEASGQQWGVNISGAVGSVGGDIVGRDKIGLDEEKLVAVLEAKGALLAAEMVGLQRRTVIMLAQRLKPHERLDFDQALTELERAVKVAIDVIARGVQGTDEDDFVSAVLARVERRIVGGLLGHWAVWTRRASIIFVSSTGDRQRCPRPDQGEWG